MPPPESERVLIFDFGSPYGQTTMAKHKHAGKTVAEILKGKRASIKNAELDEGSPSWDDILDLTWEEIVDRAKKRKPGFGTIKKLLSKGEYDK